MKYQPSEENIKNVLHLQVMARLKPKSITIPKDWKPSTQLNKLIARNMIKALPIEKWMKIFPDFVKVVRKAG